MARAFPRAKFIRCRPRRLPARSPIAAAKTALALARGTKAAHKILGDVRPAVVVGFGGYPTFPPLMAARLRGIPTVLHEQNAVLGRANRMLAKRVTGIATSFEAIKYLDGDLTRESRSSPAIPCAKSVIDASARAVPGAVARRRDSSAGVRRQPGRALFFRRDAARVDQAADGNASAACASRNKRARKTLLVSAQSYAASGITAEVAAVFQRSAGPHGGVASRHRPRRRVDGRRINRHRTAWRCWCLCRTRWITIS